MTVVIYGGAIVKGDAFGLHESIRMVEVTENATALMIPGLFVLPEPVF